MADSDGDGIVNSTEFAFNMNPRNARDGLYDSDNDSVPNIMEIALSTNASVFDSKVDTDGDGIPNGLELILGMNPLDRTNKYGAIENLTQGKFVKALTVIYCTAMIDPSAATSPSYYYDKAASIGVISFSDKLTMDQKLTITQSTLWMYNASQVCR